MELTSDSTIVQVASVLDTALLFEEAVGNRNAAADNGNKFAQALQALETLSKEESIPIAIVGGAATAYHGYPRSTKDIDIVVGSEHFNQILKVCYKYGFEIVSENPSGMHELDYKGIPIEVIEQGMFSADPKAPEAMPHPKALGVEKGLSFANLPSWVRLKLSGGRMQDYADIVQVLKKNPADVNNVFESMKSMPAGYQQKLKELMDMAEQEKLRAKHPLR